MSILVAYGSTRGGTEGIAETVADELRHEGFRVDVTTARRASGVGRYDAVVVGGALYAFRWHREAKRFVKRNAGELRERPTYLFSSGPLDDSAAERDIPPVKGLQKLMESVDARGHVTFGGRLTSDAKGFPASAMAKRNAGDWRDPEKVRAWARSVAEELRAAGVRAA